MLDYPIILRWRWNDDHTRLGDHWYAEIEEVRLVALDQLVHHVLVLLLEGLHPRLHDRIGLRVEPRRPGDHDIGVDAGGRPRGGTGAGSPCRW